MTSHTRITPTGLHYTVTPSVPLTPEMSKALWETAIELVIEARRTKEQREWLDSLTPDQYTDWLLAQDEEYAARYDAQRS